MAKFVKFDGENGQGVAEAMAEGMGVQIIISPSSGSHLSLGQSWPTKTADEEPQVVHDRWRIPVGHSVNVRTGEVVDEDGVVQDWDTLERP